jgi:hypothetical protein
MMHKAPDVRSWLRSLPYPLPSDGQLEFAVKWVLPLIYSAGFVKRTNYCRTSTLSSEVRLLQACNGSYEILHSGLRRILDDLYRSHQALTTPKGLLSFSTLAQTDPSQHQSYSLQLRSVSSGSVLSLNVSSSNAPLSHSPLATVGSLSSMHAYRPVSRCWILSSKISPEKESCR